MGDEIILLIGACISIITAYWTSKLTYKNEIGKNLYEKKEKLYFELFEILESLRKNRYLVFNDDFITKLNTIKPGIVLFSNKQVRFKFDKIYEQVTFIYKNYIDVFYNENALNRKSGMIQQETDNGASNNHAKEHVEVILFREIESYQDNHSIEKIKIEKSIDDIVDQMRSDLQI